MFARRVASSSGIPFAMYHTLHINSKRQANRMLPPMVALPAALGMCRAAAGVATTGTALASAIEASETTPMMGEAYTDPAMAFAVWQRVMVAFSMNPWMIWKRFTNTMPQASAASLLRNN